MRACVWFRRSYSVGGGHRWEMQLGGEGQWRHNSLGQWRLGGRCRWRINGVELLRSVRAARRQWRRVLADKTDLDSAERKKSSVLRFHYGESQAFNAFRQQRDNCQQTLPVPRGKEILHLQQTGVPALLHEGDQHGGVRSNAAVQLQADGNRERRWTHA